MKPIKQAMATAGKFWDQKIVLRCLGAVRAFADQRIRLKQARLGMDPDWKDSVKADFESWLTGLEGPLVPEDPDNLDQLDLFTLLGEFASLKKEIRLQSREQSKTIRRLQDFNQFVDQTGALLGQMDKALNRMKDMEHQRQTEAEERVISLFFDIRNSLNRGLASARKERDTLLFWRRKKTVALAQGYEMALDKFDRAMAILDTYPIATQGEKFDPQTMRAVDRVTVKGMAPGQVKEELASGFTRKGRLLFPARVIVTE